ncbi:hypothetical protein [Aeromonas veronii]|uniref:hypothetical protein n=1 Tax=Aeromonas veronii TaxID=654 RepID=UPI000206A561|nr:hypothetical protein [Aeromonas veronii]AEB48114.1 hypothetical protein B565_0079 [Aeromonas veronii B565]EKB10650.1 hypothetical protein HMPREF1169_03600 [Aeromonas veronii AER397]MBS4692402.1 hypothetical protein [Aeromonas veronii bv. veronii]OKP36059.1 hypothetical protein BJP23_14860 [Aeromonas veronii bv. veronii]
MANWRRAWWPGGTWFFTVNLLERRNNRLLVEQIDLLRRSVAKVQQAHLQDRAGCFLSKGFFESARYLASLSPRF